ncbi:MAG: beta-carotene 15,15'-dioxygenase [Bacteroidetes bacterium QH_1_64_81]|nr:MAG: beta-carotene 15,15'-dioxygenase [Bacteroidetes bacterium QH_1_64_81]
MADYRRGFQSLDHEIHEPTLPIEGDLPEWLTGTLIRNGPAQFEVGNQDYNHWFDGHAMLHAFRMDGGTIGYRNRFVESRSRQEALDNASINVARLDDAYVALTETPIPVRFDPETLETVGMVDFADDVDVDTATPHPHVEPETGRTLAHATSFGRQCAYKILGVQSDAAARDVVARLDVDRPSYMHSFGMTERYVVLSEWPLVVDPLDLLLRGAPFIENFEWEPERGTRFRILRKSDGEEVATCTADAAFGFHHVNAFEWVVTYPDASIIDDLYLDRLRSDEPTPGTGHLRRYRLPLDGGSASSTVQSDERLELPRIHDGRATARPYQYVYGVGTREVGHFTDQLLKIDVETGAAQTWHEAGTYPGEPVFVPHPEGAVEDDGVVLSVVLDPDTEQSFLLVLDAASFEERARAPVPHAIPFGFHGQFFE